MQQRAFVPKPGHVAFFVDVPKETVPHIVGKSGVNIRRMQDECGCVVRPPPREAEPHEDGTVSFQIRGAPESCFRAAELIQEGLEAEIAFSVLEMALGKPADVGLLVGERGQSIRNIMREADVRVITRPREEKSDIVVIEGKPQNVQRGYTLVQETVAAARKEMGEGAGYRSSRSVAAKVESPKPEGRNADAPPAQNQNRRGGGSGAGGGAGAGDREDGKSPKTYHGKNQQKPEDVSRWGQPKQPKFSSDQLQQQQQQHEQQQHQEKKQHQDRKEDRSSGGDADAAPRKAGGNRRKEGHHESTGNNNNNNNNNVNDSAAGAAGAPGNDDADRKRTPKPRKERPEPEVKLDVPFPAEKTGLIFGRQGVTVKTIKRKSRAQIFVDTQANIVRLSGSKREVELAEKLVKEVLQRERKPKREGGENNNENDDGGDEDSHQGEGNKKGGEDVKGAGSNAPSPAPSQADGNNNNNNSSNNTASGSAAPTSSSDAGQKA